MPRPIALDISPSALLPILIASHPEEQLLIDPMSNC